MSAVCLSVCLSLLFSTSIHTVNISIKGTAAKQLVLDPWVCLSVCLHVCLLINTFVCLYFRLWFTSNENLLIMYPRSLLFLSVDLFVMPTRLGQHIAHHTLLLSKCDHVSFEFYTLYVHKLTALHNSTCSHQNIQHREDLVKTGVVYLGIKIS